MISIDYFVAFLSITSVTTLSLLHELHIPLLILIVVLSSFTQPLSVVGTRSLFPIMVPRHLWGRANAIDNSGFVVASIAGPAVGGVAVVLLGSRGALLLPAGLFLAGAASILGVRVPPSANQRPTSLMAEAFGAIRYVYENRVLRLLTLATAGFNIGAGSITIGLPVIVLGHLHGGSTSVGILFAVMGLVGFATGMTAGSRQRIGHERRSLVGSLVVSTIGLCVLAASSVSEWILIAGLALMGFATGTYQVCMLSLRQRVTDPGWFGRALAVSMNASAAAFPLSSGLIGGLIGHSVPRRFSSPQRSASSVGYGRRGVQLTTRTVSRPRSKAGKLAPSLQARKRSRQPRIFT